MELERVPFVPFSLRTGLMPVDFAAPGALVMAYQDTYMHMFIINDMRVLCADQCMPKCQHLSNICRQFMEKRIGNLRFKIFIIKITSTMFFSNY